MAPDNERAFRVVVTETPGGGVCVHVNEQDGAEFASARAPDLWTALEMAIPYMVSVSQPDTFENLARKRGGIGV